MAAKTKKKTVDVKQWFKFIFQTSYIDYEECIYFLINDNRSK